jgi:hypothetical protein
MEFVCKESIPDNTIQTMREREQHRESYLHKVRMDIEQQLHARVLLPKRYLGVVFELPDTSNIPVYHDDEPHEMLTYDG